MGNCKCCIKPKTSDDVERQSEIRQSVREQVKGQRSSIRSTSSAAKSQEPPPPPPPSSPPSPPPSLPPTRNDPARASITTVYNNWKNRRHLVDSNGPDVTRASVRSAKGQRAVPVLEEVLPRSIDAARSAKGQWAVPVVDGVFINVPNLESWSFSVTSPQKLNSRPNSVRKKENIAPNAYSAYDDNGKRLMGQLKQKYGFRGDFNFGDICTIMWKEDDHLEFNRHYKFSRNKGLSCNLDASFLASHPTYAAFHNLLKLHSNGADRNELQRAEERFLVEVMKTRVMQICWAFLKRKIYAHLGKNDFKNRLKSIWFPDAFEHIFIGYEDEDSNTVKGLHNYLQYSFEFNEGNITYMKCNRQVERMMIDIQYTWNDCFKDSSSMFIGTSPEFELSLYTLLYAAYLDNNQENTFECLFEDRISNGYDDDTDNKLIIVKIIVNGDKSLKTAYPVKP